MYNPTSKKTETLCNCLLILPIKMCPVLGIVFFFFTMLLLVVFDVIKLEGASILKYLEHLKKGISKK